MTAEEKVKYLRAVLARIYNVPFDTKHGPLNTNAKERLSAAVSEAHTALLLMQKEKHEEEHQEEEL